MDSLSHQDNVTTADKITCVSCRVFFENNEIQRAHYKTDWHRYNLKRKVAELPPVTENEFNAKVEFQTLKKANTRADNSTYCHACGKLFSSKKSFENHVQSKKHKALVRQLESRNQTTEDVRILLIILNQPITSLSLFKCLWDKASFKVCCDGGANRVDECSSPENQFVPDLIGGDGDSIREDIKQKFLYLFCSNDREEFEASHQIFESMLFHGGTQNSKFVDLPDQNDTDFTKCLIYATEYCQKQNIEYDIIVGYPGVNGRLDHTMSNINTLYLAERMKPCYLLSNDDVACLLQPGESKIMTNTGMEGEWCGLIPIGGPATSVTTTGLKYNVENREFRFGGLISSSNSILPNVDHVSVVTTSHLLFSLGYKFPSPSI